LWAVCSRCGRWNLTPIEERWEAIEECEKQYRATITRAATDEIGLGRVREGTDLIRIGKPLRPEFAAWRYGRRLEQRRRLALIKDGGLLAFSLAGFVAGGGFYLFGMASLGIAHRVITHRSEVGRAQRFIRQHAARAFGTTGRLQRVSSLRIVESSIPPGWALRLGLENKFLDFEGRDAMHAAHLLAPMVNIEGGKKNTVRKAVEEIEIAGSPEEYFVRLLKFTQGKGWKHTGIHGCPDEMRLAFEMASHEETERIAVEGELAQLETDWREAEEIASIADNLFLPQVVTDFLERHRSQPRQNV
jgi:hypothetical protein